MPRFDNWRLFVAGKLRQQCRRDFLGNRIFDLENVCRVFIKLFRPTRYAFTDAEQLRRDANVDCRRV